VVPPVVAPPVLVTPELEAVVPIPVEELVVLEAPAVDPVVPPPVGICVIPRLWQPASARSASTTSVESLTTQ
jgi:hypothetical protein